MSLSLMLALQAAQAAAPPPAPAAPAAIDFDLARYRPATSGLGIPGRGCVRDGGSTIVVCGPRRSGGAYPLAEMARIFEEGPLVAEMGLGGTVVARSYLEAVELAPGLVSNRVMVGIRLPF